MCKNKVQTYKKGKHEKNIIWNYDVRSYSKLTLNKLKEWGVFNIGLLGT
jgi:hypothetical protein